jgi:hypothetical protein
MPVRFSSMLYAVTFSCAFSVGAALWASGADAQSPSKRCGDEWKTAKAAGTVPASQKRADFIKECRDRLAAQPGAATPAPATQAAPANPLKPAPSAPAAEAAKSPAVPTAAPAGTAAPATGEKAKKPMSPGMAAFHEREKKCGEEWRTNTDQIKAQTPGITWPKYLSACNKRLKAAGQ